MPETNVLQDVIAAFGEASSPYTWPRENPEEFQKYARQFAQSPSGQLFAEAGGANQDPSIYREAFMNFMKDMYGDQEKSGSGLRNPFKGMFPQYSGGKAAPATNIFEKLQGTLGRSPIFTK